MNIQEAAKRSEKENKMMFRKNAMQINGAIRIGILPTDSYATCLIAKIRDGKVIDIMSYWNPTLNDLAADDWELAERPPQEEWPKDRLKRFGIFNT